MLNPTMRYSINSQGVVTIVFEAEGEPIVIEYTEADYLLDVGRCLSTAAGTVHAYNNDMIDFDQMQKVMPDSFDEFISDLSR